MTPRAPASRNCHGVWALDLVSRAAFLRWACSLSFGSGSGSSGPRDPWGGQVPGRNSEDGGSGQVLLIRLKSAASVSGLPRLLQTCSAHMSFLTAWLPFTAFQFLLM